MIEVLRVLVSVLIVASLLTIVGYLVVFLTVVAWTVLSRPGGSPGQALADELDEVLAEILGHPVPSEPRLPAREAPTGTAGTRRHAHGWGRGSS